MSMSQVKFKDFVNFVREESELANDPIFSPDVLRQERKSASREGSSRGRNFGQTKSASIVTGVTQNTASQTQATSYSQLQCPLCERIGHELIKCFEFKKKSLEERRSIVNAKGLCFGCLKLGHFSADCQERLICKECKKSHPTLLHGAKSNKHCTRNRNNVSSYQQAARQSEGESANANSTVCRSLDMQSDVTTSMIIPVIVHHKDNPDNKVKTYALLDDGSDSTFITDNLLTMMGLEGTDVSLQLNTMHGKEKICTRRVDGLIIQDIGKSVVINLPKTYSRAAIPSHRHNFPSPEIANKWSHLRRIKHLIPIVENDPSVGLLVGCNCPKALKPREVILGKDEDPYAVRTLLGWGIIAPTTPQFTVKDEGELMCNRIFTQEIGGKSSDAMFRIDHQMKEVLNPLDDVKRMFELEFTEHNDVPFSQDDIRFLDIVKKGIRFEGGHYVIPLPLKKSYVNLHNNRSFAHRRLQFLKKRFENDETYRKQYIKFMNNIINKGYAEKVPEHGLEVKEDKPIFFKTHHGVYNEKKGKIRVVFNCSEQYRGVSLNNCLLQGPDLTNTFIGVLCRFRHASIALMADIESMFYQVQVPVEDRDFLRFLWWPEGDTSKKLQDYRMTVLIFGASSSPGCSNYVLKATANDNEQNLGSVAANVLRRNFYVDDGLVSVDSVSEAVDVMKNIKEMCHRGGFNLHKFTSNSKEVLKQILVKDRAETVRNLNLGYDALPLERALGVQWCADSDTFKFVISLAEKPCTRRGILSTTSTIFDPLGFVAPILLEGKAILQKLCRNDIRWDDSIPDEIRDRWMKWKSEITELQTLSIPRCYRPENFGKVVKAELHHFSDASFKGYGQCSFLRLINEDNRVHCSFVIGKSRVTPLRCVSIPRLELAAAVLSVRMSEQLKRELDMKIVDEVFWSDSKVVLGYINNNAKRFHVYVANRIQEIRNKSSVKQWKFVHSKVNPADDATRGLSATEFIKSKWSQGPAFLWKDETEWEIEESGQFVTSADDPEIKKVVSMVTNKTSDWSSIVERLKYFSDWLRAKRAVALCLRYMHKLKDRKDSHSKRKVNASCRDWIQPVTIKELQSAEVVILKAVQREAHLTASVSSTLVKLDPYIDIHGILRVGGKIKLSNLPDESVNPVILPKSNHVTDLILRHFHNKVQHQGRGITMNEVRASGYWIIGMSSAISSIIHKCITCRKLRSKPQQQRMAILPKDRVEPAPPITYSAVDYFGPFTVKERRKEVKRYGVIFTCMASRAVHVEVADTSETDSFICALRRFICRRGPIRQLRSDQGTNFVGAKKELKNALQELDNNKIIKELHQHECDWFTFRMNVPSASHMGGIWERQIRSVRAVLNALLLANGSQLNCEALRTFLCEAEAIVNSRPLTVESFNDPLSLNPITPNHLLTLKTKVVLPPPGKFLDADQYSRKRWRRVQHLANEFWSRWKKEFLLTLQTRQKWQKPRRNMCINDIVIIKDDDDLPRNKWRLARVVKTYSSVDGYIRSVKLVLADAAIDSKGKRMKPMKYLDRPVQKLVLLQQSES